MITVRFMTLSGPFKTERKESFVDYAAALAAVSAHAAVAGYTAIKTVDDDEDGGVRFTARSPGGRSGRNVAFGEEDWEESFP